MNNHEDDDRITTLEARERPEARHLISLLREAITAATGMGVFERLMRCRDALECRWPGRRPDGRLTKGDETAGHGGGETLPQVFRWEGAPDIAVPLCATIVRWLALIRMSVYNRANLNIGPRRVPAANEQSFGDPTMLAAVWQNTLEHLKSVSDWSLSKAYDLFGTCVEGLGYGILLVDWKFQQREERVVVETQQVFDALLDREREMQWLLLESEAAMAGDALDPEAGLPPEMEQAAQDRALEAQEELLAAGEITPDMLSIVQSLDERMTPQEARRVIAGLRKRDANGQAEYFAPKDDGGCWDVEALIPWVNCLHPYDMTATGEAGWFARSRILNEAQLRDRARVQKWDKAATKRLLEDHKNQYWAELRWGHDVAPWALNGVGVGMVIDTEAMKDAPCWLVVDVWIKVTNAKGLPRIGKAVLSPHMEDTLLLWTATDLEELPILVDTAEPTTYAMMAEGAAGVIEDKQNFVKDTLDGEGARGQLGSRPPLLRTVGQHVGIRPGKELYAKRTGSSFEGSKFMEVPQVDVGALRTMESVKRLVDEYYFRAPETSESDRAMFEEGLRFRSVRSLTQLVRLLWRVTQESIDVLQVSRVNGRFVNLEARRDQLAGEADISIGVHLDGFNKDAAEKFIQNGMKLMQGDRGGNFNSDAFMDISAQLLSPTYARQLVMTPQQAQGRVIDEQEGRIAKIVAGVPVRYEENPGNPQLRMKVMNDWMAVPGNVERVQGNPVVAQLFEKELEWLQFSIQQQTVNPTTGRTGVKANEPEEMGV